MRGLLMALDLLSWMKLRDTCSFGLKKMGSFLRLFGNKFYPWLHWSQWKPRASTPVTSILQDAAAFTADKDFGARENHYETDVNPLDEVLAEKGSSANETQARKDWDADKKEEEMDELVKGMSLVCTLMIGKVFGHINLSSNVGPF